MWKRILGGGEPPESSQQAEPTRDVNPKSSGDVAARTNRRNEPMTDTQVQSPKADIGKQQIGTVYAKAFLAAASTKQSVERDLSELGALLATVIDKQPTFEAVLASPRIAIDEKIAMLEKTLKGRVSDGLLTFLDVVCRHERLDCLREIYFAAREQYNESNGIAQVQVTTAQPLDDRTTDRIKEGLAQHLDKDIELLKHVDPAVIGGMIIRIGDMVYDTSVRQRLVSIREQTVEKAAQQMRQTVDQFASK